MYASLIGSNPRQLKCDKGDELSGNGLSFLPVWIDFVFFFCSKLSVSHSSECLYEGKADVVYLQVIL